MPRSRPAAPLACALALASACSSAPAKPQVRLNRLNLAVQNGDAAAVRAELDAGADPCAPDADGHNALLRLLYHRELAATLLERAAETACPEALYYAANHGRADLVKSLLGRGVSPEAPADGQPPLSGTCINPGGSPAAAESPGQVEAARLLLEKGANPNAVWKDAHPLLWYAIVNNHPGVARLLIAHGADPHARGYLNRPVLAEAVRHPQTARLLLEKGADPEAAVAVFERDAIHWQQRLAAPYGGVFAQDQLQQARNSAALIQRLAAERRAAPAAAGGVSKDELTHIVQAAVREAERPAAPAPAAAVRSDVDQPAYRRPEDPAAFALVVGIGKYSDLPEADFAERDAAAVKEHLLALGFPSRNVVLLSGEKASRSALEKFIETWLPRNVAENGRVVFYFSGHGAPDPTTGRSYLVPWDGDPGYLENTAYPLERLYEKLGALKARSVVVLLDSCFSGAGGRSVLAKGARPLVVQVDAAPPPDRIAVLAAASGSEIASTAADQGHGLFTYHLLKGVSEAARGAPGAVTVRGLHTYLKPKVQDTARRQNRSQTPTLLGPDAALDPAR